MMTEKRRKTFYWGYKIAGILISCFFPIWAIYERFPLWKVSYGKSQSIGAGGILALIVLVVIFRKTIFNFMRDRMKLRHAPPLLIWLVMLIISYTMMYLAKFLYDISMIFWMGLIGCAIGTLLTFIAEHFYGRKEREKNERT